MESINGFVVAFFLSINVTAYAETCSTGQESFKDLGEVANYIEQLNQKIEGELGTCESLVGIYKQSIDGHPKESLRVSKFLPNELILMKGLKSYDAAFKIESLQKDGSGQFDGIAVLDRGKWKIAKVVNQNDLDVHSVYPEGRAFAAFEKFKATGRVPHGAQIETIEFSADRAIGQGERTKLTFDDEATIKGKVADSSASRSLGLLSPNEETRVHRGMYSLLDSKDFREARDRSDNTKMVDLLWARALELMKGDKTAALYLALLSTDLRTRGPCGSFYARRGRELVPSTVFDGEKPSAFKEHRLDALQHFFGYALLQHIEGQAVSEVVSKISKDKDYYSPRLTNLFKHLHVLRSREATKDSGGFDLITSQYFERERTGNDIEVDKFYNKLGIEFGRRLSKDGNSKPSSILNDTKYNSDRRDVGLASVGARDWYAFDPKLELPSVYRKPPEQRDRRLASLDYSAAGSCIGQPLGNDCRVGIKAAAAVCANAEAASESKFGCRAYRVSMKLMMTALKESQTKDLGR